MIRISRNFFYASSLLVLFFVGIHRAIFFTPCLFEHVSSCLAYPFLVAQNYLINPIKASISNRSTIIELENKLADYRAKMENLLAQNIELTQLDRYNVESKDLYDFSLRYKSEKAVISQILLKHFDATSHYYYVDAGSNKGINVDMCVVYKNCLIGRISEVYPYYSKVILITDRTCKIAAYCSATGVQGIHQGDNDLSATTLSFVNHLETLKKEDMIISSGEGLVFPRGFGIGTIKHYEINGFHYKVSVEPLIDLKSLTYCLIIQKGAEQELKQIGS